MSSLEAAGYVLAFDVGTRMIGVAIGHPISGSARALTTIKVNQGKIDWSAIDALDREWQAKEFVVGLPLALDGSEQEMTRHARAFCQQLRQRYARPVHESDERFTSKVAARRFARQRAEGTAKRKHGAEIDALAAQIILETWFASPSNPGPSS